MAKKASKPKKTPAKKAVSKKKAPAEKAASHTKPTKADNIIHLYDISAYGCAHCPKDFTDYAVAKKHECAAMKAATKKAK